jgi:Kef-type K+ transport system membrane component KefB
MTWSLNATILGEVGLILVLARLAGWLFGKIHQPPVIGEVIAGVLLGPTLLHSWSGRLFPPSSLPVLGGLAELGVVLFMFAVGLELHSGEVQSRGPVILGVAVAGTLVPFAGGFGLGLALSRGPHGPDLLPFALFMGAAMSITAFPVLARILVERGLYDSPLGQLAMACAAGDDVLTWITLALVIAIATSSGLGSFTLTLALAVAFTAVAFLVVRPLLRRYESRIDATNAGVISLFVAFALLCGWFSSGIGIHSIFGAFVAGAVVPRPTARVLRDRIGILSTVLLPVFFVATGLKVDLSNLGLGGAAEFAAILAVACVGKILGAGLGSRLGGLAPRESLGMGVLMNTRGLTELIVLTIGLQERLLSPERFSLLVLMAIVTTVATAPLIALVRPDPLLRDARAGPGQR